MPVDEAAYCKNQTCIGPHKMQSVKTLTCNQAVLKPRVVRKDVFPGALQCIKLVDGVTCCLIITPKNDEQKQS